MRVLQLTTKPPFPPVDGGTRAMHSAAMALLEGGCEVRVLSMCSGKHPVKEGVKIPEGLLFEALEVDLGVHPWGALKALFTGRSYNVERFCSAAFRQRLEEVLSEGRYEVVQLESLYLLWYVPAIREVSPKTKIILRSHNVEWQVWERLSADRRAGALRRWYLRVLTRQLRRYEESHANDCDGVVFISGNDAAQYRRAGCRLPMTVIPYGYAIPPSNFGELRDSGDHGVSLFHIGAMDWQPNLEGIHWLLREVWPAVHKKLPDLRLYLAGRRMPQSLKAEAPSGVVVVGEVDDADTFVEEHDVCVVPLMSGSGMRVKIIEAMSHGKAVVATPVAAEGIECRDGHDIMMADIAEEFAAKICRLAACCELRQTVGENGRRLVDAKYSNKALAKKWIEFYSTIIQ